MRWSVRKEVDKELRRMAKKQNKRFLRKKIRRVVQNTKFDVGKRAGKILIQHNYKSGVAQTSFGKIDS